MAKLLDRYGNPIDTALLKTEVATPTLTGVRRVLGAHPTSGLTPQRLAQLLLSAESGYPAAYLDLAEEMEEKYLHYASVLNTRKRAILGLELAVEAAGDTPEEQADAGLVESALPVISAGLYDIMDALGKGYSASEIIWDTSAGQWMPARLEWRDPRWFVFSRLDGRTLRLRDGAMHPITGEEGMGEGLPLPPYKFLVHHAAAKSGIPIRGGLARAAAWSFLFANYAVKDWVVFAEVFGQPIRLGKYEDGITDPAQIQILLDALRAIGTDAAAAIPKSMDVSFVAANGKASGDLYENLARYLDDQVSKLVLGYMRTSDNGKSGGGLGSGSAEALTEVRYDILHSDTFQLAATLNRDFVRPLVDLNKGPRKTYPKIVIRFDEQVDLVALADNIVKLRSVNAPIPVKWALDKFGIPEALDGEPTLGSPPSPAGAGGGGAWGVGVQKRGGGGLDTIDTLAASMSGDWRQIVSPMSDPIQAALDASHAAGETAEQFLSRLPPLLQTMDPSALTERLARAAFAARLMGEAGIEI